MNRVAEINNILAGLTTEEKSGKLIISLINISIYWVSLGDRLMVGLQNLDLPIGVRVPVSQFDFGF